MRHYYHLIFSLAIVFTAFSTVCAQDKVVVKSLTFEGNKITRQRILQREMTFKEGDTLSVEKLKFHLERSRSNLWNLTLFNFVEIDTCTATPKEIEVVVRLVERWYVWPVPILEFADRNFREWWETKRWDRIDFGSYIFWHNFRGLNQLLVMELRFGFNNRYQLRYEFPFIDKAQKFGLQFSGGFEQNHEVAYKSADNKRVFYKDPKRFIRQVSHGSIIPTYRPNLYNVHELEVSFTHASVADTIVKLNPEYFGAKERVTNFFSIEYKVVRNLTDYSVYPLTGYRFEFRIRKDGLRILDSPIDLLTMEVEYAKYWKLHPRWYISHSQKIKASSTNQQPYALQRGLGYETNFVRGYELYVVDGQHYGLLKTAAKWAILPMRKIHLKFLKSEKFSILPLAIYANLNFDMGYVIDKQFNKGNPLAGSLLMGGGLGIDVVTFYDIAWRFEYSVNKRAEHGFFLHFTKHI
ncbi:POTRA domain-containing protein [Bacteroidota bacterium]